MMDDRPATIRSERSAIVDERAFKSKKKSSLFAARAFINKLGDYRMFACHSNIFSDFVRLYVATQSVCSGLNGRQMVASDADKVAASVIVVCLEAPHLERRLDSQCLIIIEQIAKNLAMIAGPLEQL